MKKILFLLAAILIAGTVAGALTPDTNLALSQVVSGSFTNLPAASDGLVSAANAAVSGDISKNPQILTIDLGAPAYISSIRISWDRNDYSKSYDIRVSSDSKSWYTELAGANAGTGAVDSRTGTISQNISGKRFAAVSRYVQIYIPLQVDSPGKTVRIAEVQVFPATGQKIAIDDLSSYLVTDKKAIVTVRTNIGAAGASVSYGLTPDNLDQAASIQETGLVTSATLPLLPGRSYFYKARVTDLYGNVAESSVKNFAPAKENVALGKKVLGTFTELPPRDSYVNRTKDVLSRITDGAWSYFSAMATSRSVHGEDQYAIIDLGNRVPVSKVVTYWRNLAYPQDFSISISDDNVTFSDGIGTLNAAAGAFTRSETGDPMRVLVADLKGVAARYIRVTVKKDSPIFVKHADWNFVQLMEVEVIPQ